MNDLSAVLETVNNAGRIALLCHDNPDGDTLGSALALRLCLEKTGKHADVVCQNAVPKKYRFLKETESVLSVEKAGTYDTVLLVDMNSPSRSGASVIIKDGMKLAAVDHHVMKDEPDFPHYVRSDYGACAIAVLELIDAMGTQIGEAEARLLYAALSTDTGNFTFSNAGPTELKTAARLAELIDVSSLCEELYNKKTLAHTMLVKTTLEKVVFAAGGKIAYAILDYDDFVRCGADGDDAEGIIDSIRFIDGVKASFIIRENSNGKKNVSMRTDRDVDAKEVMATIGGGGHIRAAGASFYGDAEEYAQRICRACGLS